MTKLMTPMRPADPKESNFEELKQRIHSKLVDKLDLTQGGRAGRRHPAAAKSAWSSSISATAKTRC